MDLKLLVNEGWWQDTQGVALLACRLPAQPSLLEKHNSLGGVAMDEKNEVKTLWRFVKTRLSQAEHQGFALVLQRLGTNGSRFLRKVIREVIGEGPDFLINELQAFREVTFQVGAIGRNLNQLVRAFHSGQLTGSQVDASLLIAIRDQVAKLEKELLEIVRRSRQRWVNGR